VSSKAWPAPRMKAMSFSVKGARFALRLLARPPSVQSEKAFLYAYPPTSVVGRMFFSFATARHISNLSVRLFLPAEAQKDGGCYSPSFNPFPTNRMTQASRSIPFLVSSGRQNLIEVSRSSPMLLSVPLPRSESSSISSLSSKG